ncbi:aldo/keto reductase [Streptomyces sp. NPDC090052]|uniref:aldo/keto reductase n=1 Tax=unclassified Streptomyces TaxID=2593676 RepID=UPI0038276DA8|nr:aldo/keto reductase [Streptomyces sp. NBC_00963]
MTTADGSQQAPGGTATLGGRRVARIGFGAMQLALRPGDQSAAGRDKAMTVLRDAVTKGVNHLDTAQFYGAGACNALIRDALHPFPDDLVIVSKVGARDDGTGLVAAQRPEELRAEVEANLTGLDVEQLAVVNLRRLDVPPGLSAEGDQIVDLDSQLAELTALRDEGKIGAIGLSSVGPGQLRQALPAGIACVQNAYSVLDRSSEPLLDLCREHGIAWVPFFPLGSAFPGVPKVTEHPAVVQAAASLGATPAQVGLAWQLAHYAQTLLIPGTSDPAHLDDNIAAGSVRLPSETVVALDRLADSLD